MVMFFALQKIIKVKKFQGRLERGGLVGAFLAASGTTYFSSAALVGRFAKISFSTSSMSSLEKSISG